MVARSFVGMSYQRSSSQAGQASTETAGLVVLVALLFAALAAWAPGAITLPDEPPPFIERVGAILGVSAPPLEARSTTAPAAWVMNLRGNDDAPIGNFLRRTRDFTVDAGRVTGIFAVAFAGGAKDGATARVVQIVSDPIGTVIAMVPVPQHPIQRIQNDVRDARALVTYIAELRGLTPEDAARRLGRDTGQPVGAAAVDALLTRSLKVARTRTSGPTTSGDDRLDATKERP